MRKTALVPANWVVLWASLKKPLGLDRKSTRLNSSHTTFFRSALGFDKWLPAFWMIVNAKNGISSCELGRALGVTQKTAWFRSEEHTSELQSHDVLPICAWL